MRSPVTGHRTLAFATCAVMLLFLTALCLTTPARAQAPEPAVRTIGITTDGKVAESAWLIQLLESEFTTLMAREFTLEFPTDKQISAGGTRAGARLAHDRLLADDDVDLIISLGPLVSAEMVARGRYAKPVIAPFVLDVFAGSIPRNGSGGSGIENLSYIEPVFDFAHDVRRFRELTDFSEMVVLGQPGLIEIVSARAADVVPMAELDLVIHPTALTSDPVALVKSLPRGTDAAFLIGPPQRDAAELEALLAALHARGIATFSVSGEIGVREGVLAGLTPADWWPRLMRRAALNARHLLTGDSAADLPVQLTRQETYYINMATARALGISPTFDLMSDAELLGDLTREPARVMDLPDVMREALERNRDVQAAQRELEAGRKDVSLAWSTLLPQIEANLGYRLIDEDRATQATAGAEKTLAASGRFSQVLWSERALAGVAVQKALVRALEGSLRQQELDVALQAASTYFDVLAAKAVEEIRRDNLRLTRSNLERAQVRLRLGAASPAEGYRWESQVAQDQDALVTSIAQRNLAEIELNRVLSRPLEDKLGFVDPETVADVFRYLDARFLPYIDDPASLRLLRAFVADVAFTQSPELAQIDAAIAVQERLLASETRSFFSPDVALTGEVTQTIDRGGAGADLIDMAPMDDTDWQLQLGLSLPLFTGTSRLAQRAQVRIEILRLARQREAAKERIEQRVRSAIHVASASFTRIGLTQKSESAARRNFELVADAYGQGALSIIDLLDAQTAWFNAQQQAASAAFQFLGDVMEVERASGGFSILQSAAERDDIFTRLEAFAAAQAGRSDLQED